MHHLNPTEALAAGGQTKSTIRRKLTALRPLFFYLQPYGYSGANPAHGKFVAAPAVPCDGKAVALSPHDCRSVLEAPEGNADRQTPVDLRDRAMRAVLAYSGCRVGELIRLRVRDLKTNGEKPLAFRPHVNAAPGLIAAGPARPS
jgi:site-specific recombinase XerD